MRDLIDEAKKLISLSSVSADGNEEIANYLIDRMKGIGLKTQLQQISHSIDGVSKRQFNIIGILGDPLVDRKTKKGLLLNTHLDTVSGGIESRWTETGGNPWNATIKEGKIFGLGSADVKLDFLCKLRAIERFREKKIKSPIYLVGTCAEEIGMLGAKYLIQSGILNPKFVIVGEPSELKVIYAHKSLNLFKISISFRSVAKDARGFSRCIQLQSLGKSAHGAYPHLGINAINQLFELVRNSMDQGYEMKFAQIYGGDSINKVPDRAHAEFYLTSHQLEDYKRFFKDFLGQTQMEKSFELSFRDQTESGIRFFPDSVFECTALVSDYFKKLSYQLSKVTDPSFSPAHSTINFGAIKPSPQGIELFFDSRILPDQDSSAIEKEIIKDVNSIASHYSDLNVSVVRQRHNPGLNMTEDHELVRICKDAMVAAGLSVQLDKKATSTEAAQYFKAGYESIIFGPGLSQGNSHSPNEFNWLNHLDQATTFYEKLIERVCL